MQNVLIANAITALFFLIIWPRMKTFKDARAKFLAGISVFASIAGLILYFVVHQAIRPWLGLATIFLFWTLISGAYAYDNLKNT